MPFGSLKAHLQLLFLQAAVSHVNVLGMQVHNVPLYCFWFVLLNSPGKDVYRDELSSSLKRVRVKSWRVPAEPWLSSKSSLWRLAPLRWLRWLLLSLHVILLLWGTCGGLSMPWLNQVLFLVIQTGWYSPGSQTALAGALL